MPAFPHERIWLESPQMGLHLVSVDGDSLERLMGRLVDEMSGKEEVQSATVWLGCGSHVIGTSIERDGDGFKFSVRKEGTQTTEGTATRQFGLSDSGSELVRLVGEEMKGYRLKDPCPALVAVACQELPFKRPSTREFVKLPAPDAPRDDHLHLLQSRLLVAMQYGLAHEVHDVAQIATKNGLTGAKASDLFFASTVDGSSGLMNAIRHGRGTSAFTMLTNFKIKVGLDGKPGLDLLMRSHEDSSSCIFTATLEQAVAARDGGLAGALATLCRTLRFMSDEAARAFTPNEVAQLLDRHNANGRPLLHEAYLQDEDEKDAAWALTFLGAVQSLCDTFGIKGERVLRVISAIDKDGKAGVSLAGPRARQVLEALCRNLRIDKEFLLPDDARLSPQQKVWLASPPQCRHLVSAEGGAFGRLMESMVLKMRSQGVQKAIVWLGGGPYIVAASIESAGDLFKVGVEHWIEGNDPHEFRVSATALGKYSFADFVGKGLDSRGVKVWTPALVAVGRNEILFEENTSGQFIEAPAPGEQAGADRLLQTRMMMAMQYGLEHEVKAVLQIAEASGLFGQAAVDLVLAPAVDGSSGLMNAIRAGRAQKPLEVLRSFSDRLQIWGEPGFELLSRHHESHDSSIFTSVLEKAIADRNGGLVNALCSLCGIFELNSSQVEQMLCHPDQFGRPLLYRAYVQGTTWALKAVRHLCWPFEIKGARALNVYSAFNSADEAGVRLIGLRGRREGFDQVLLQVCRDLEINMTSLLGDEFETLAERVSQALQTASRQEGIDMVLNLAWQLRHLDDTKKGINSTNKLVQKLALTGQERMAFDPSYARALATASRGRHLSQLGR